MRKIEIFKKLFKEPRKKEASVNKIKTDKIKSATPHHVLRVILWIVLAFLMIKGVVSIFKRSTTESIEAAVQQKIVQNQKQTQMKNEAAAFAEGFCEEYTTYKVGNTEDYQKRLSKYLPQYLLSMGQNISAKCDAEGVESTAISCDFYSESQINVDVRVKVKYLQKQDNSNNQTNGTSSQEKQAMQIIYKDIFLRVPIIENGGKYTVEDLPLAIPAQEIATLNVKNYSGKAAADTEAADIKKMLQNFLKTYCEGNDTELNYFMSDSKAIVKGLKGTFKFNSIDDVRVFYRNDKSSYLVTCSFMVVDINSGQELKQNLHFSIIKKDGRYYIKSFDTRSINLNNDDGGKK